MTLFEDRTTETIETASQRLQRGEITSASLIDSAFARINDPHGQGALAFTRTMEQSARRTAAEADSMHAAGLVPSPLSGLPISVKDLFDVAGDVTRCGSRVLDSQPAATRDAAVVSRLRSAGAIIVGRTNMTEFAYSGLGLNPHFGTPLNPYDRQARRIPGGSSSGAAVAVSDGMCIAAIGSDTGGSIRIPAALCGLVGFKPTQRRVPMAGVFPLSPTLDTVGPIARTVACCAALDAVIAGGSQQTAETPALDTLSFGVLRDFVLDDTQPIVMQTFEQALAMLSDAGASIRDVPDTGFLYELPTINANGGIVAAESYHLLHKHIQRAEAQFDPRVLSRIRKGSEQSASDYLQLLAERRRLTELFDAATWQFDAVICPTVPWVAPRLDDLADDHDYFAANGLMLRNPSIANFMDRPAISVPCHRSDEPPVGLMLIARRSEDRFLLGVASAAEAILSQTTATECAQI